MRKLRKDPDPKLKDNWGPFSSTIHVAWVGARDTCVSKNVPTYFAFIGIMKPILLCELKVGRSVNVVS